MRCTVMDKGNLMDLRLKECNGNLESLITFTSLDYGQQFMGNLHVVVSRL